MKRTININLAGFAFSIEDNAYTKLNEYLNAIRAKLGNSTESDEVINDIEARMAELFIPVTNNNEKAITVVFVEDVIKVLGSPADYTLSDEEDQPSESKKSEYTPPMAKRLYRDPHSRIIAGVCSGLGAYFNIDPILFRLLFIIGVFGGLSIIPYLILWIVMPKALTIEQRMQMTGGESQNIKGAKWQLLQPHSQHGINRVLEIFGVIVGVGLVIASFVSIVIISLLFSGVITQFMPPIPFLHEHYNLIQSGLTSITLKTGLSLIIGVPILILFYVGLQLIFRFKSGGKTIGTLGLILWLAGLGLLIYSSVTLSLNNKESVTTNTKHELQLFGSDTLYLRPIETPNYEAKTDTPITPSKKFNFNKGKTTVEGTPKIEIIKGGEHFSINIETTSMGWNVKRDRAQQVEYFWMQNDSVLQIDHIFMVKARGVFKNYGLKVVIEMPDNKEVIIDPSLEKLINYHE